MRRAKNDPLTSIAADGLFDIGSAANFLHRSKRYVHVLLNDGTIPYGRLTPDGDRLIPRAALVKFIESRLVSREATA